MGRLMVWLLVLGLAAAGAYGAYNARYEYFTEGSARMRKDRLTGAVQAWECVALYVRGTESAYFPMAPGADPPRECSRFGWRTRK